jgi:hypothetical protein
VRHSSAAEFADRLSQEACYADFVLTVDRDTHPPSMLGGAAIVVQGGRKDILTAPAMRLWLPAATRSIPWVGQPTDDEEENRLPSTGTESRLRTGTRERRQAGLAERIMLRGGGRADFSGCTGLATRNRWRRPRLASVPSPRSHGPSAGVARARAGTRGRPARPHGEEVRPRGEASERVGGVPPEVLADRGDGGEGAPSVTSPDSSGTNSSSRRRPHRMLGTPAGPPQGTLCVAFD